MKTDCLQPELTFQGLDSRKVCAQFNGGAMTSDAGGLLLREAALHTNILSDFAACFTDGRDQRYVRHDLLPLISQRVMAIALGYEDINDHDDLRNDPLMALVAGRPGMDIAAGKSTIQRMENKPEEGDRYNKITYDSGSIDRFLVDHFLSSKREVPKEITLDLDATDVPIYGDQQDKFYQGYYGHYCYLPLYITCDDFILCARLRPSNIDAPSGWEDELPRIAGQIRKRWPDTRIVIRADSGFCRDALLAWCEANNISYVIGLAKNSRLKELIKEELDQAKKAHDESGHAARIFSEFEYRTRDSWSLARRVVAKAEHLAKGSNPRFVVTNLPGEEFPAAELYEKIYCARGDMENRIKEHQADMFADRMSASVTKSNQLRLYLSTVAYMLITTIRREALRGTALEMAQAGTIRLKLLKIGARITTSVRRICLSMSSGYPLQELFAVALARLQNMRPAPA